MARLATLVAGLFGFRRRGPALVLAGLVGAGLVPGSGAAQTTPYVPTLDPAYADLDVLVSTGLVQGLILGQRPYSRMTFARAIEEARVAFDGSGHGERARIREAVERLEARFAAERALLCTGAAHVCPRSESYAVLRNASADASLGDSPARPVPTPYSSESFIDADVNPLLQGNQGRILADGWTLGGEGVLDFVLGNRVAAQIQPRVWLAEGVDGAAEADGTLVRGYARSLLGDLSVEVGRNHVPHGQARAYGSSVSDNARGFDLVRLSLERPVHLPWIFRYLGPIAATAWLADMGGEREFPHSKLIVFEGAIRPHPNLELGAVLLNHQGGEGAPEATFTERLEDIFLIFPQGAPISDKLIGFDAALVIPAVGTRLYVEVTTTDDRNWFSVTEASLGTEAVWTAGFRVSGLGEEGRWDVWGEGGRDGVRPYTHHQFTSGLTLDRRIIGSPLGPVANGITLGLDWIGSRDRVSWSGTAERYQGDRYWDDPTPGKFWERTEDNPDEIRLRTTLDWTRRPALTGLRTSVRLGYEHVTRFDFTDRDRNNVLVQVGVGYVW